MDDLLIKLQQGDARALARCISIVENEGAGYTDLLEGLPSHPEIPITGITGPPGAGKSTLISALAKHLVSQKKKIAIIAVDPSSPFNKGALMGDRLRMSEHFLHPDIFIRSMATRGSLGGLAPKIFEVADVFRAAGFDHILIETVGVGQSEVEIAALADTTVLVLVPEAGDEIQTIKSGVMEIADIYVLNKSDREGADAFAGNLRLLTHSSARNGVEAPVIKTVATKDEGIATLVDAITQHTITGRHEHRSYLLAEKAMMMIREMRSRDIRFADIEKEIQQAITAKNFNLYRFVKQFSKS